MLINRKNDPFKGSLALPGGFVDYGEDPGEAALRELKEECNLKGHSANFITVRGHPKRDPRKHIVSLVYQIDIANSELDHLKPMDDASDA